MRPPVVGPPRGESGAVNSIETIAGTQPITDRDFQQIREWIHARAGIYLSSQKKALVSGRLAARLRHYHLTRYGDYFKLLQNGSHPDEPQVAVDLLTTNETHFFREPRHFEFLRDRIVPAHPAGRALRVWSAACSSGEEPYSIGMTLASSRSNLPWEILASDLSQRVLDRARAAVYPMQRAKTIPRAQLLAFCLKGIGQHEGTFRVDPQVTSRVRFTQINLNGGLPAIGEFEVIFLRNVMIYFDPPTKQQVIDRVLACLRPGGYLMIGHSESLASISSAVKSLAPAIYQKP
jgi:chemotaxis protein methyltransferase CheR